MKAAEDKDAVVTPVFVMVSARLLPLAPNGSSFVFAVTVKPAPFTQLTLSKSSALVIKLPTGRKFALVK